MRLILLSLVLAAIGWSQTISEFGAAAAGGAVGGAAGKKVSDGITNVLDKIDQHTTAAAASPAPKATVSVAPAPPLLQVSPGIPGGAASVGGAPSAAPPSRVPVARAAVTDSVPPPPPLPSELVKRAAPPKPTPPPVPVVAVAPPPPPVTPDDLRAITPGESRADVLKLGVPATRITMADDGHLLEVFRYMSGDTTFGVVRVIDGAVSQVDLRP